MEQQRMAVAEDGLSTRAIVAAVASGTRANVVAELAMATAAND